MVTVLQYCRVLTNNAHRPTFPTFRHDAKISTKCQLVSQAIRHTARAELLNVRASHLVDVAELPEEDQQLLLELDPLGGMRQVRLDQRVVEEPRQTSQDEAQILVKTKSL